MMYIRDLCNKSPDTLIDLLTLTKMEIESFWLVCGILMAALLTEDQSRWMKYAAELDEIANWENPQAEEHAKTLLKMIKEMRKKMD